MIIFGIRPRLLIYIEKEDGIGTLIKNKYNKIVEFCNEKWNIDEYKKNGFVTPLISEVDKFVREELFNTEELLGINEVEPIRLTLSDSQDTIEKEDDLREWYEDELNKFIDKSGEGIE